MVPRNIGTADRVVRLLAGILLLGVAIFQMRLTLLLFALFCFFESAMSWCAVYQILGINTCRCKKGK